MVFPFSFFQSLVLSVFVCLCGAVLCTAFKVLLLHLRFQIEFSSVVAISVSTSLFFASFSFLFCNFNSLSAIKFHNLKKCSVFSFIIFLIFALKHFSTLKFHFHFFGELFFAFFHFIGSFHRSFTSSPLTVC